MTNHVHLLVTPTRAGAVGRMLQDVGRRYVRVINTVHGRTGTLWEGRFKSSLIDSERYLIACHRYIERNPVDAGLADHPAAYPWCSYAHYAGVRSNSLITEYAAFRALGTNRAQQEAAFRDLVSEDLDAPTAEEISTALEAGCLVGSKPPARGRPRKKRDDDAADLPVTGKSL